MEDAKETRWLSSDERDVWLTLVGVMMKLPAALDTQLQQDAGLSHFEYMVLAGLSEAPSRTRRMSELADFTGSGLPRLSQVVGRLEKRGWVQRSTDTSDRRITLATLTDEGWDKIVQIAPGHVEAVRSLVFDPLTKAQSRQLGSIGKRILGAVDPEERHRRGSTPP